MTNQPLYLGWTDVLPVGWRASPLRSVASYRISSVDKIPVEGETPVRLCNYTDVYYNEKIAPELLSMVGTATPAELSRFRVRTGDVLITKDSESWDDIAIPALVAESAPDVVCGYHLALLRPDARKLTGEFLIRCLQAEGIKQQFQIAAVGVTRYGLPKAAIGGALIPTPPLPTQRLICGFLDEATNNVAALIEKKQRLIELLDEKRSALISRAVTQGLDPGVPAKDSGVEWLGPIPKAWDVKRLKYLTAPRSPIQMGPFGSMLTTLSAADTGYKLFGQENTISGDFSLGSRWVTAEQFKTLAKYLLSPGDIVLTRKGSIGKARIVPNDAGAGIMDSDTVRVRANAELVTSQFLVRLLHEAWYVGEQILANRRGAILSGLNSETIGDLIILVPPLEEQRTIERFQCSLSASISTVSEKISSQVTKLREYRSALITAAVTGQLDIREHETKMEALA
jgi:type I restriction enzyme S subunit